MPAISVIIPVYGVEQYMERCARSLFGQTFQDIEFIFIDDCTPDRSMEVMQRVLEDYPNRKKQVRCYRMPHNSGQAKVRMQGISMATGEYVIHCDSDDEVAPDAYRKMYQKAVDENLDLVIGDYNRVIDGIVEYRSQYSRRGEELSDLLFGRVGGELWSRLMKHDLLYGIIPPLRDFGEDLVITYQATSRTNRIGYVSEPVYVYHKRKGSISESTDILGAREGLLVNAEMIVDLLQNQLRFDKRLPAIVYYKYSNRDYLIPYVHIPEYYKKWRSTFPEVDRYFLFTPKISFDTKFWFILIHLHLYHPWKLVSRKIRAWIKTK